MKKKILLSLILKEIILLDSALIENEEEIQNLNYFILQLLILKDKKERKTKQHKNNNICIQGINQLLKSKLNSTQMNSKIYNSNPIFIYKRQGNSQLLII
ncbi:unnamed protein product [Paramecium octaurelia]|uniref:Uncharacterized protein n=1 Tax=Paramecium octaurelia TaxID=43137 RepID=A0A8S1XEC0_PAROT|nr:unnamed protein product [Paramecium octaurelia]